MINNKNRSWLTENTLNYTKTISDHNFGLLVGYTSQKYYTDYSAVNGYGFPSDAVRNIDQAAQKYPSSATSQWALVSFIGRFNYDYKGKYILAASLRRDGSSKFGANNLYANFPAVSAGWVISEEKFMNNIKPLSFLKIRGSYGFVGNDGIPLYNSFASIGTGNTVFNNQLVTSANPSSLANDQLGWERTKQTDLGLDASFLNNRITLTYDYYSKKTDKLLYNVPVPYASGFSSIAYNIGTFKYWGNEFTISSKNLVGEFKWSTDFNISFNDNKVLALGNNNQPIYGNFSITQVGSRIGQFYGYVWEGLYKDAADIAKSPIIQGQSQPGTLKFKDVNGDGKISINDNTDKTLIGNPNPKFVYGISNSFYYKHFDLSVVLSGSYGNKVWKAINSEFGNLDGIFNVYKSVANRWRSESDPGSGFWGDVGPTAAVGAIDRSYDNSRSVYNASYLTIKNVSLGYMVPFKNTKYIRSVRAYVSVQQLYVFTKYDGSNPEVSSSFYGQQTNATSLGVDYSAYPVPRTFTFGANFNF